MTKLTAMKAGMSGGSFYIDHPRMKIDMKTQVYLTNSHA
jgi:hypothetical protein